MLGLMQDWPLTVDKFLDHAKVNHGAREVVTRSLEGPIVRTTWGDIHDRAKRLSNALLQWGIKPGDRVATLALNTGRHVEAWYGIMGIGAVCHTLNPRLFVEHIAWIIDHAGDRIVFVDLPFVPLLEAVIARCPTIERVVVMTDDWNMPKTHLPRAECYERVVREHAPEAAWGGFSEETACGLCYTSGTTGDPKGVLYSHRSNFLHTLIGLMPDVMGGSVRDVILPIVPMFHANAWGIAFSAPAVGAKLVLPGGKMDGPSVYELIETEGVTFSAAVPTVWQGLLQYLQANKLKFSTLKSVLIGGSACPENLIRAFHDDYGVEVVQGWGMTEMSPLGTTCSLIPEIAALPFDQQVSTRLKQGRAPIGVEPKIVDPEGKLLPNDGQTFGHLMVRGPACARAYFRGGDTPILDGEGYFDTGDVATIDSDGYMQITDRAKDVVKSGGEWISSIDVENIAVGHPKAAVCAVIGIYHPKWDERPILIVELKPGETATKQEFLDFLQGKVAKWWMPDDVVFVDSIPLGATGKIDKKKLREQFKAYKLPTL
jgi:fatty-acyl-CoA synthase